MIHSLLNALIVAAEASPVPTPPGFEGDPNLVTPGVVGFIVTFAIAVLTVLLIVDMTRRIRSVRYRAEIRERLESEAEDPQKPVE